jgi:hypothetical protein
MAFSRAQLSYQMVTCTAEGSKIYCMSERAKCDQPRARELVYVFGEAHERAALGPAALDERVRCSTTWTHLTMDALSIQSVADPPRSPICRTDRATGNTGRYIRLLTLITVPHDPHCSLRFGMLDFLPLVSLVRQGSQKALC